MSEDVILGVHSNVRKGQMDPETGDPYGFDAGHAWISVTRDGKTTRYGLWPDAHPNVEDNGGGSDIRTGMEDSDTPAASRYYRLTRSRWPNSTVCSRPTKPGVTPTTVLLGHAIRWNR